MTFGRPSVEQRQAQRAAERERNLSSLCQPSRSLHRGVMGGSVSGQPVDKSRPVRSEAYRRLVAELPCFLCGLVGYSQAAHADAGKGLAIKSDDRTCYPLCGQRSGVMGCHYEVGTTGSMTREARRELEERAGRATRAAILASGKWPARLPKWEES
jgi:hypothetical protein